MRGKRVVVIGSGATAVTLVPALAERAAHVTMLQRSPTYIVARPSEDAVAELAAPPPANATGASRSRAGRTSCCGMYFYNLARRRPDVTKQVILRMTRAASLAQTTTSRRTSRRPTIPGISGMCLVPDADLFAAIKAGKASVVTDQIETFTETGIRVRSGEELDRRHHRDGDRAEDAADERRAARRWMARRSTLSRDA